MKVTGLYIYPVKSLRGIAVDSLSINQHGVVGDREWMLIDDQGKFLSQRRLAKMCLIESRFNGNDLILHQTGHGEVKAPRGGGKTVTASVWRDTVNAQDCGDEVSNWLSQVLGKSCRLVYLPKTELRRSSKGNAPFAFADGYPLLLANQSSLEDFNQHLSEPVSMLRFRPNVVVESGTPYSEDTWPSLQIRQAMFNLVSPCTRCIIPSIDPDTGDKQAEVTDALNKVRRFGNETRFGQNMTCPQAAKNEVTIHLNDEVNAA